MPVFHVVYIIYMLAKKPIIWSVTILALAMQVKAAAEDIQKCEVDEDCTDYPFY